jgi:hypothetical protein
VGSKTAVRVCMPVDVFRRVDAIAIALQRQAAMEQSSAALYVCATPASNTVQA